MSEVPGIPGDQHVRPRLQRGTQDGSVLGRQAVIQAYLDGFRCGLRHDANVRQNLLLQLPCRLGILQLEVTTRFGEGVGGCDQLVPATSRQPYQGGGAAVGAQSSGEQDVGVQKEPYGLPFPPGSSERTGESASRSFSDSLSASKNSRTRSSL